MGSFLVSGNEGGERAQVEMKGHKAEYGAVRVWRADVKLACCVLFDIMYY